MIEKPFEGIKLNQPAGKKIIIWIPNEKDFVTKEVQGMMNISQPIASTATKPKNIDYNWNISKNLCMNNHLLKNIHCYKVTRFNLKMMGLCYPSNSRHDEHITTKNFLSNKAIKINCKQNVSRDPCINLLLFEKI